MRKMVIGVSGKKQSGKTSLCEYLSLWFYCSGFMKLSTEEQSLLRGLGSVRISQVGDDPPQLVFCSNGEPVSESETDKVIRAAGKHVKMYSFADPLKQLLCNKVLGVPLENLYGTDDQKNADTDYLWDRLPESIRCAYSDEYETWTSEYQRDFGGRGREIHSCKKPRSGPMSGRELMQVVGTDVFRQMFDEQVWVNATFNVIASDDIQVALIADCRFESEIDAILKNDGYVIRLNRKAGGEDSHPSETALDGYPFDELELSGRGIVVDNDDLTINQKNQFVTEWMTSLLSKEEQP